MTVLVRGIVTGSWFIPWTLASVVLVLNPGVSQSDELWRVYSRLISSRLRLPQPCKKKSKTPELLKFANCFLILLPSCLGETHEFWLHSWKIHSFKRAIPHLWYVVQSLICCISWLTLVLQCPVGRQKQMGISKLLEQFDNMPPGGSLW